MKPIISKVNSALLDKGKTYYFTKSDFCGECWHIFVALDRDAHLFNIFSQKEFNETFSEV